MSLCLPSLLSKHVHHSAFLLSPFLPLLLCLFILILLSFAFLKSPFYLSSDVCAFLLSFLVCLPYRSTDTSLDRRYSEARGRKAQLTCQFDKQTNVQRQPQKTDDARLAEIKQDPVEYPVVWQMVCGALQGSPYEGELSFRRVRVRVPVLGRVVCVWV